VFSFAKFNDYLVQMNKKVNRIVSIFYAFFGRSASFLIAGIPESGGAAVTARPPASRPFPCPAYGPCRPADSGAEGGCGKRLDFFSCKPVKKLCCFLLLKEERFPAALAALSDARKGGVQPPGGKSFLL